MAFTVRSVRLRSVLLLACALRLAGALAHARQGPVTQPDEANYLLVARALVEDGRFATHPGGPPEVIRGPLYPLFLAPFVRLGGPSILGPAVAQALLGTLTAGLLALALGRALVRAGVETLRAEGAASWAAVALAVSPVALLWERLIMSEGLATTLAAAGAAAWMEAPYAPRPWPFVLASGLCLGALALAKPAFLLLPLVLAAVSLRALVRSRRLACAGALIVLATLSVAPWTARNHGLMGRLVPVGLGSGLFLYAATLPQGEGGVPRIGAADEAAVARYLSHDTPVAQRLALDDDFRARARARIREQPRAYLGLCARRAARLWASSHAEALRPWPLPRPARWAVALSLGAVALFAALSPLRLRPAELWGVAVLLAVPAYTTVVHAVLLSGSRYSVVAWPFVICLAACASPSDGRRAPA